MGGYKNNVPYLYLIDRHSKTRYNVDDSNQIVYSTLWTGYGEGISNLLLGQYQTPISFNAMPLKDAIDFTEFLIDTQIKYDMFKDGLSYCGGPIDILVLTSEDQFFYRHKFLNS